VIEANVASCPAVKNTLSLLEELIFSLDTSAILSELNCRARLHLDFYKPLFTEINGSKETEEQIYD